MAYKDMPAHEMLMALGNDAQKWAEAFCEHYPHLDQDLVAGWFANAMMTMWDHTNSTITHDDTLLVEHIEQLVRNRRFWVDLALPGGREAENGEVSEAASGGGGVQAGDGSLPDAGLAGPSPRGRANSSTKRKPAPK